MFMKKNSHISPRSILFLLFLLVCSTAARAQFKIVDGQDGKPVAGAYVFSSTGSLLCISDADGNIRKLDGTVTISDLAYEPTSVDASKTTGVVYLREKAYTLPEVTVGKADYVKLSGAFRDICRNDGKTILYREGLMDFYINTATGKIKRRVRACRQYEARGLRKIVNFKIAILGMAQSTDLARIKYIKRDTISSDAESAHQPLRLDVLKQGRDVELARLLPLHIQLRPAASARKALHLGGGNERLCSDRRPHSHQGAGRQRAERQDRDRRLQPARLPARPALRRGKGDCGAGAEEVLGDVGAAGRSRRM